MGAPFRGSIDRRSVLPGGKSTEHAPAAEQREDVGESDEPVAAKVHLVDAHDNGGTGGADALYARTIHVADGATLDLQGLTVYAETVTIEGTGTILGQVITVDLTPEPGDITGDGVVTFDDLVAALAAWGPCPSDACAADLDGDGMVGLSDVLEVLANWSGA